ncbi:hypothetical protein ACS0TY_013545 [Phlomoides rotata]
MRFDSPNHPASRLSPKHNSSNLLDSYELEAVTKQINRAILASNGLSTPRLLQLKSPFYLHRLDKIYKENSKTPKKILSSKKNGRVNEGTIEGKGTRGFMVRLWKKVKQGFVRGYKLHS